MITRAVMPRTSDRGVGFASSTSTSVDAAGSDAAWSFKVRKTAAWDSVEYLQRASREGTFLHAGLPGRLPISVAATGISSTSSDSDHLNDRRKSKRDEAMWGAMASRKSGGNNRRRNLAAVPESLPGAIRIYDKRSPRRLRSGRTSAGSGAGSCAGAIGFIVSMAAASRSARWEHSVDRSRVGAGSSVSLSRIDGRLGQ
jgi:hypothetical protein